MNSGDGAVAVSATNCRKPSSIVTAQSDDEISVIAVIKKGTSGIPKRARYHYIRELPLASVKSLKSSLQKAKETRQGRVLIPDIESCALKPSSTKESINVVNEPKKPRVIELSDEISKMELRRQFKIAEKSFEDQKKEDSFRNGFSAVSEPRESNIIHKLPPGTILVKQEPKTPRIEPLNNPDPRSSNPMIEKNRNGSNTNGSSAATTTTNSSSSNSTPSSSASSVSSCGSGSSSGDFASRSASPSCEIKRTDRTSKGRGRKTIVDVIPRRNPKRSGSKKETTIAEVAIPLTTGISTRPRQRQWLLSTRRQLERNRATIETGNNKKTKLATMPYMNTRSVTRKLYTVGATYQAPTRKDETEWREWPVHGMHERPVFHPQIGLAAGYAGRVFWSTTNDEGSNWTYREVLDTPEEVEIVSVDPRPSRTPLTLSPIKTSSKSSEESFEVCMHESLHSVLAYCAQVMAPGYRQMIEKDRYREIDKGKCLPEKGTSEDEEVDKINVEIKPLETNTSHLNLSQLEDSSISDETLMEISSIYKKLLPIEDQPSSHEISPSESAEVSPHSGNNYKRKRNVDVLSSSSLEPKNPSEASEIARILSEYNESLKEKEESLADHSFGVKIFASKDCGERKDAEELKDLRRTSPEGKTFENEEAVCKSVLETDKAKMTKKRESSESNRWLEDLLVDTSLLYCVATGVGQHDLKEYIDGLDAKQSLQWLRRRDG